MGEGGGGDVVERGALVAVLGEARHGLVEDDLARTSLKHAHERNRIPGLPTSR